MSSKNSVQREAGFDIVRVIASVALVFLHVSVPVFSKYNYGWDAALTFNSFSRICVPLFFMLSGALLTRKETNAHDTLNRVYKIIFVLFFWSYFYLICLQATGAQVNFSPLNILAGPVIFHFWYFYSLVGVYLFIPVLGLLIRSRIDIQLMYLAVWFIGSSLIPTTRDLGVNVPFGFDLSAFPLYAGYAFAGAFFANYKSTNRYILISLAIFFCASILTLIGTQQLSHNERQAVETIFAYRSPLVVIAAISAFFALKGIGDRSKVNLPFLPFFASNVVGVFILHIFYISLLGRLGIVAGNMDPWIGIPVVSVLTWLLSIATSAMIRSLPIVGRHLLP